MFIRTADLRMVNLDMFQIVTALPSESNGRYIVCAERVTIRESRQPWLATADDKEEAKKVLDKIESALRRGDGIIDLR